MSSGKINAGLFNVDELSDGIVSDIQSVSSDFKFDYESEYSEESDEIVNNEPIDQEINNISEENPQESNIESVQEPDTEKESDFSFQPLIETLFNSGILQEDLELTDDDTDDLDGFKKVLEKSVNLKLNKLLEERDLQLSETTKKRIKIESSGGNIQELYNSDEVFDYNLVELDATEENGFSQDEVLENQRLIYSEYLADLGHTEKEINDIVEEKELSGSLKTDAIIAKRYLVKRDEQKVSEYIANKKKEAFDAQEKARIDAENFKTRITSTREIGGFTLDKNKAEKLYNFIAEKDKEGKSEFDKRYTPENVLLFQYLLMEGFDKVSTLKKQAETKATQQLKKTLHKFSPNNIGTISNHKEEVKQNKQIKIPSSFWGGGE